VLDLCGGFAMTNFIRMPFAGLVLVFLVLGAVSFPTLAHSAETGKESKIDAKNPPEETKQIARLIAANELMRLHWTRWVTGKELKGIAEETAKGINEQLENLWTARFLVPRLKATGQRLDEFEKQGVMEIRAGVAEVWNDTPERLQYMRGMRATTTCLQCHRPLGEPALKLEEGDLLGIISVNLKR
jgi:hypothetical protein